MKLKNLKIGARLGLGFGVVLLLMAVLIASGLSRMAAVNAILVDIVDDNNVKFHAASEMRDAQRRSAIAVRGIVLAAGQAAQAEQGRLLAQAFSDYDAAQATLAAKADNEKGKAILARIASARSAALAPFERVRQLALEGNAAEGGEVLAKQVVPAVVPWQQAIQEMMDHQARDNAASRQRGEDTYNSSRLLMLALGAGALVLGAVAAVLATRSITHPLNEAVRIAQTVARGDLSSAIEVRSTDETGQMLQALKDMNASLHKIVGEVREGTETIATASSQIASGNLDLSARTEEQASSLEETASSMEELTSTVKQNGDHARQANELAESASLIAQRGGAVVSEVVTTMGEINDSAKRIADIIGVIDGIAFQTNILALNAAVEAARAGEQGRGFAVVASEVRNLAQRCASAAKDIKQLIGVSVERVGAGGKQVEQAGETMREIVDAIRRVTDIMGDISAAGREQQAGIEQINQAVTEMDAVTQQNAALVEESAAAAESLRGQAANLAELVSVFKLATPAEARVLAMRPGAGQPPAPAHTASEPGSALRKVG